MVLSWTVSEIYGDLLAKNCLFFLPLSHLAPSLPMFLLEFRAEVNHEENRVMGLSYNDSSFWKYKVHANICGGSPGRGRQTTSGLSTTAIFGDLGGHTASKTSEILQAILYEDICWPLSAGKWLQNEWPWMTLSGYLMSKSVFGQHFLNQSVWVSKK